MAKLFGRDVKTIGKHVNNALKEELNSDIIACGGRGVKPTVAKFAIIQLEGNHKVIWQVEHYSLDMILSVGFRVKSSHCVLFRAWVSEILKQYITKDMQYIRLCLRWNISF